MARIKSGYVRRLRGVPKSARSGSGWWRDRHASATNKGLPMKTLAAAHLTPGYQPPR